MKLDNFATLLRDNIFSITAYTATLYYLEIINFMFVMNLVIGRIPAIIAGLVMAALLTLHIILLNSGKEINRWIHLFLMDFHAAISVSSLASFWLLGSEANIFNIIQIVARVIIMTLELPLIIALTDIIVISRFRKENST